MDTGLYLSQQGLSVAASPCATSTGGPVLPTPLPRWENVT